MTTEQFCRHLQPRFRLLSLLVLTTLLCVWLAIARFNDHRRLAERDRLQKRLQLLNSEIQVRFDDHLSRSAGHVWTWSKLVEQRENLTARELELKALTTEATEVAAKMESLSSPSALQRLQSLAPDR